MQDLALSRHDRAFVANRSFASLQRSRQFVSLAHTKLVAVAHAELVEVEQVARGGRVRAADVARRASRGCDGCGAAHEFRPLVDEAGGSEGVGAAHDTRLRPRPP